MDEAPSDKGKSSPLTFPRRTFNTVAATTAGALATGRPDAVISAVTAAAPKAALPAAAATLFAPQAAFLALHNKTDLPQSPVKGVFAEVVKAAKSWDFKEHSQQEQSWLASVVKDAMGKFRGNIADALPRLTSLPTESAMVHVFSPQFFDQAWTYAAKQGQTGDWRDIVMGGNTVTMHLYSQGDRQMQIFSALDPPSTFEADGNLSSLNLGRYEISHPAAKDRRPQTKFDNSFEYDGERAGIISLAYQTGEGRRQLFAAAQKIPELKEPLMALLKGSDNAPLPESVRQFFASYARTAGQLRQSVESMGSSKLLHLKEIFRRVGYSFETGKPLSEAAAHEKQPDQALMERWKKATGLEWTPHKTENTAMSWMPDNSEIYYEAVVKNVPVRRTMSHSRPQYRPAWLIENWVNDKALEAGEPYNHMVRNQEMQHDGGRTVGMHIRIPSAVFTEDNAAHVEANMRSLHETHTEQRTGRRGHNKRELEKKSSWQVTVKNGQQAHDSWVDACAREKVAERNIEP